MTIPDIRETIPDDVMEAAREIVGVNHRWIGPSEVAILAARAIMAERERTEVVRAQAFQVIGNLLDRAGVFDTPEATRALDYFADGAVDENFLPWPRDSPDYVPAAIRQSKEPVE